MTNPDCYPRFGINIFFLHMLTSRWGDSNYVIWKEGRRKVIWAYRFNWFMKSFELPLCNRFSFCLFWVCCLFWLRCLYGAFLFCLAFYTKCNQNMRPHVNATSASERGRNIVVEKQTWPEAKTTFVLEILEDLRIWCLSGRKARNNKLSKQVFEKINRAGIHWTGNANAVHTWCGLILKTVWICMNELVN